MLAVEPSTCDMLRMLPLAHGAGYGNSCSFHHSDSLAFNLSDGSLDFDIDFDEATIPVNPVKPESIPASTESSVSDRLLHEEFSSSWPCNKHRGKVPEIKHMKKKQQRRSSMLTASNSVKKQQRKTSKVRFSPTLEVRTHSIVLGDHPFCEDGLALELGWEYEDSRDICEVEHKTPRWRSLLPNYPYPKREFSSNPPRHLSAVERKRLLLEVGGCSESEIRLRQFQTRILLQVHQLQVEARQQRSSSRRNPVSRQGSPKPLYAAMA